MWVLKCTSTDDAIEDSTMKLSSFFSIFKKEQPSVIDPPESNLTCRNESAASDSDRLIAAGIAKATSKDYLGALRDFDKAIDSIKLRADTVDSALLLTKVYLERSKVKTTLKDHKGVESDRKQVDLLIEKMDVAFAAHKGGLKKYNSGDYPGAITDFDRAVKYGLDDAGLYHVRGLAKRYIDDFDGAFQDFNKAIKKDPCHSESYYDRGLIKSHVRDDDEGALRDFDKAIELNPNYIDAYYSRARLKDDADAVQDLSTAIHLEPTDARLLFARSLRKCGSKDYEGAVRDLNAFIELSPTDSIASVSEAYSLRGWIRILTNDVAAAIQDQTKAIALDPRNSKAFLDRGVANDLLKDYKGAVRDFSKVIELDPSNAEAFHKRGLAKLELGEVDEGRKDLIDAISLGYTEDD